MLLKKSWCKNKKRKQTVLIVSKGEFCVSCGEPIPEGRLLCPICEGTLKNRCSICDRLIAPGLEICPYCEQKLIDSHDKS